MWHPHMGLCTGLTLGCLTVATPSALAQMLTRRQTWSCHLSNLWGSGDATPSLDAAPACQAGPTPTSPLPTRSTRIQKPVSGDSASFSRNASSYYSTLIFLRFCFGFFLIGLHVNTLLIAPYCGLLYCPTECLLINCWRSSYLFITATEIIKWL